MGWYKSGEKGIPPTELISERLILKLLAKRLDDQEKSFSTDFSLKGVIFDGLASEGIDDLPGPTLVEIKSSKVQYDRIKKVLRNLCKISIENKFKSVLLVVATEFSEGEKQQLMDFCEPHPIIRIWDSTDLSKMLQENAEFFPNISPSLSKLGVNNIISKSREKDVTDSIEQKQKHIDRLKKAYSENNLVLFLGSGISSDAGIPKWDSLVSDLLIYMIERKFPDELNLTYEEKRSITNELKELHGKSPLLQARYIRDGLGDSFEESVSKFLYKNVDSDSGDTSEILESIARLCVPGRSGPGVKAIVTYNFDDLIEFYIKKYNIRYRSICRDIDVSSQDELGIYHVHGFLPRNFSNYEGLTDGILVFSEDGYHRLILEPYSWSNIVQLNFFRECTCLMIGLSLTDPNLRRLLDIAAQKNTTPKHYVLFQKLQPTDLSHDSGMDNNTQIRSEVVQQFLSAHHALQETSFRNIGLNVIWFERFDEIPRILDHLTSHNYDPRPNDI